MNTLFRSSNSDLEGTSIPSQSPIPSLPKSYNTNNNGTNNPFIVLIKHYSGDLKEITLSHEDPSVHDAKLAYVDVITKMSKQQQQHFFAEAQMAAASLFSGGSNNNKGNNNNNSINSGGANNNNQNNNAAMLSPNTPRGFYNNNSYNSINSIGGGIASTRFSGVLGKSFSMKSVKADDLTFAARDGHILHDCERISSLRSLESMNLIEIFVVPFAPYRPEEPLLVVSPLFPLPTSSSQAPTGLNNNGTMCQQQIIIKDFDFSSAIAEVSALDQKLHDAAVKKKAEESLDDNNKIDELITSSGSPASPPNQRMNTASFLSAEFDNQQNSTEHNNNGNTDDQDSCLDRSPSKPPLSRSTLPPQNNNNNNSHNALSSTSAEDLAMLNNMKSVSENQSPELIQRTSSNNTLLAQTTTSSSSGALISKELSFREVPISTVDQLKKRASGLGGSGDASSPMSPNNNNNRNSKIDCGDLIVHVLPGHSMVIENSDAASPQHQKQKNLTGQCVEHFCRFRSAYENASLNRNNNNRNNNNRQGSRGNTNTYNNSKSANPFNSSTTTTNRTTAAPPPQQKPYVYTNNLSLGSAPSGSMPDSPSSSLSATNNVSNSNTNNTHHHHHQAYNNNNNNNSPKEIHSSDRKTQYFSSHFWSPVHAWISPDGNFVIVHIIEKDSFVSRNNHNNNNNNSGKNTISSAPPPSTAFLIFESAARGSSWLVRGCFRLPLDDISISGWASDTRFVLCVGSTHCVVKVQQEGSVSVHCTTLIKSTVTEKVATTTTSLKKTSGKNDNDNESEPSSSTTQRRFFFPALQLVRILNNYTDGTLMWFDPKNSILRVCHPARNNNNNNNNNNETQNNIDAGFAIHFKRRIGAQHAFNYNYLLQSRSPKWNLASSALPQFVISPGDSTFQGFTLEETSLNQLKKSPVAGKNDNNNNSSSSKNNSSSKLAAANDDTANQNGANSDNNNNKPVPKAIYFLHRTNIAETAPDPPNEAFLLMFQNHFTYVSEYASTCSASTNNTNTSSSPTSFFSSSPKPASPPTSANFSSTSSLSNNNILREDKFVTSFVSPPIQAGSLVCAQYAKPVTATGFSRLRVVYTHDDEDTGVTSVHIVILQSEWKDKSGNSSASGNSNNNNANGSGNNNNSGGSNNNNQGGGGGIFDYFKKKISFLRGSSDDVLAANASKDAERIALATHKQLKFEGGGMQAFQHGACDCFMATSAPVGLIVKATGSGGVAVVRLRAGLQGS